MSVETLNVCMGILYSQGIFDRWHIGSYCFWDSWEMWTRLSRVSVFMFQGRSPSGLALTCALLFRGPFAKWQNFLSQWRFLLPRAATLSSCCLIANIYLALLHYCKLWLAIRASWCLWQFGIWRALMKLNTAFACHPSLWMGKWK